jgi:hypothetical protein
LRTFKEKTILAPQLALKAREGGNGEAAERFEDEARLAERHGEAIREWLRRKDEG